MSNLKTALAQTQPSGIYRFTSRASVATLTQQAAPAGWRVFDLNGTKIKDKPTFLNQIAQAMSFPYYFGKNWDALNDCLTDLEWAPAKGYVVLFQDPARFMKNAPADWDVAIDLFNTAIQFWTEQKIPFYVLLRGAGTTKFPTL